MLARPAALLALAAASTLRTATAFVPKAVVTPNASRAFASSAATAASKTTALSAESKPICIVVEAEIKEDRMEEFLDLIEKDAVGSRAEEGCLRFDVLRSTDDPNVFYFYEVYKDADAVAFHKATPHFALWTNFKETEGIVKSVSKKADGWFMS